MARILVIDDELAIADLIAQTLRDEGYSVDIATDGRYGLELVAQKQPDLVISDVMMPQINGLELCRRIRRAPATQAVPVILMSAAPVPKTDEPLCSAFLAKPFDLLRLIDLVETVLA